MGWDASLVIAEQVDCPTCGKPGHTAVTEVHSASYTHNVAPMIYDVLERSARFEDVEPYLAGRAWWCGLHGLTGEQSLPFLSILIDGLRSDPKGYRGMNPASGNGSYSGLLVVLDEMLQAAQRYPDGEWAVHG